jgi:crossover junction endodeoxyribonuclease RusA
MTPPQPFADATSVTGVAQGEEVASEENEPRKSPRSLRVVVFGAPATQGSKKAFIRGKKVSLVEMDAKLPAWRAAVESAARLSAGPTWEPIDAAVSISGEISLQKPKTTKYPDAPAGTPDLDKLQRAIGDALTKARVIADDARIVHWNIRKVWGIPGADFIITEDK